MTENAVLYALSTLAQTCAALAAFVGAVGVFRLQVLRAGQDTAERNGRGLASQALLVQRDVASLLPFGEIVNKVTKADSKQGSFFGWSLVTLDQVADLRDWEKFAAQTGKDAGAVIGEVVGVLILFSLILTVPLSVTATAIFGIRALVRAVKRTTWQTRAT